MTTITREQQKQILIDTANHVISRDNTSPYSENLRELARIALASLDAEPVAWTSEGALAEVYCGETGVIGPKYIVGDVPLYRHAQPVSVDKEFIPKNLDKALGVVGVALPESKEEFNFQIERWIQRLIDRVIRYADEFKEQPVPVVPDDISGIIERFQYQADHLSEWHHIDEHSCKVNRRDLVTALEFMNSCRAAMLQGVEPVSNHDELALYYLQGQKDGLEWAAQLAEANHPLTGDWLYDDPLELAKAIRKGPDMPGFAGSSPVTPDGWISCSERMPDNDESKPIAIFTGKCLGQGMFVATYDDDGFFDYWEGMEIIGVSHWMPLPEPPQQ